MASITVLVDDRAGPGLVAEHGLALWIEWSGKRLLFDTGQGRALLSNAEKMDVDLSTADAIILSHGHYDHTGGLATALELAARAKVYLHPSALEPKYGIRQSEARYIGMPEASKAALSQLSGERKIFITDVQEISCGIGLAGYIPRNNDFEDTGGPFYLDPQASRPDRLDDDLAMWIDTPTGLVVITGCAHAGIANTIEYITEINRGRAIRAVVGGFHLAGATQERLGRTADRLKLSPPSLMYAGHCSGSLSIQFLEEHGRDIKAYCSGMKIEI